jgi:glycerophosphoryl diester phosphodiesterase
MGRALTVSRSSPRVALALLLTFALNVERSSRKDAKGSTRSFTTRSSSSMRHYASARPWLSASLGAVTALGFIGSAQATPGHDHASHGRRDSVIAGHRGSPGKAPEETLASYVRALAEGAEVLEGDVQLSSDGVLVLVHDDNLVRTSDAEIVFPDRAPWNVGQFTLAELKRLDAGTWFDARFAGQRVTTVHELLQLTRGRVALTLELKNPAASPGVGAKLAQALLDAGVADGAVLRSGAYRVHVHSRDEAALREFHAVAPKVQLAVLTGGTMLADERLDELSEWTVAVYAHPRATSALDVERAHERGLLVFNDPVDSEVEINMALNQGYDWIITNFPEVVGRVLGKREPFPDANGVVVDRVLENPSGDDVQPEVGEYVALRNTTDRPIDVGGHYLRDQATNLLRIGAGYVIPPGSLLRVYVGPGTNRADAYYNGLTTGFLNNTGGDTISYFNERHELIDIHSYIVP